MRIIHDLDADRINRNDHRSVFYQHAQQNLPGHTADLRSDLLEEYKGGKGEDPLYKPKTQILEARRQVHPADHIKHHEQADDGRHRQIDHHDAKATEAQKQRADIEKNVRNDLDDRAGLGKHEFFKHAQGVDVVMSGREILILTCPQTCV